MKISRSLPFSKILSKVSSKIKSSSGLSQKRRIRRLAIFTGAAILLLVAWKYSCVEVLAKTLPRHIGSLRPLTQEELEEFRRLRLPYWEWDKQRNIYHVQNVNRLAIFKANLKPKTVGRFLSWTLAVGTGSLAELSPPGTPYRALFGYSCAASWLVYSGFTLKEAALSEDPNLLGIVLAKRIFNILRNSSCKKNF